ncbi:response regulator transcription factor [Bradyrhizobium frederickii]|uniref:Regulatory protein VirG n=1 Tax=Bradyrhizobium frederickii TaxID=2560054 RepID=A0A4Y9L8F8_9BRAD|nr:response regulator transcription factor [Bradyrhizobium frederickii]TFV38273.1 response regulator transcription factor [Bradyrhizobium frederickii]
MNEHTPQILVVDDDPEIRKLLARYIESQSLRVVLASNCSEMRERLAAEQVDLVVLDVMLPDGSGLDACRDLRAKRNMIPVILLTALKEDVDRIVGLEMGADDYLGKPFNPRELVARIRAVLRRRSERSLRSQQARKYRFDGLTADPQLRSVTDAQGNALELTGAEFDLLQVFLDRPGRVLSRDQLLDLTRGREGDVFDRSIDVLVSRLRRKLDTSGMPPLFKTVRNGGYQLVAKVGVQDFPA